MEAIQDNPGVGAVLGADEGLAQVAAGPAGTVLPEVQNTGPIFT